MNHSRLIFLFTLLASLWCTNSATHADAAALAQATDQAHSLALHDGDVWVMAGDSITWQNLYAVYLEAFLRARYPNLKFAVINSGKSGEVYIQSLVRFRATIAAYEPTLVTAAYGMNDHTKVFPGDQHFVDDPRSPPQRFVEMVQGIHARLIMISSSPLLAPADYATDGGKFQLTGQNTDAKTVPGSWRSNPVNKLFAQNLQQIALRNHVYFFDQMTPLQMIWAANHGRDRVAALRNAIMPLVDEPITTGNLQKQSSALSTALRPFLDDASVMQCMPAPDKENLATRWRSMKNAKAEQWESLRQFLRNWCAIVDAQKPPFVQLSGYTHSSRSTDLIHPNEAGHLHIAAVLLKLMNADGLVSEVTIDALNEKVLDASKTKIHSVNFKQNVLSFDRLDESLPLPVDSLARPGLAVDVETPLGNSKNLLGMSRYLLKVTNLPRGEYEIAIDATPIASVSSEKLSQGFDAGLTETGPVANQAMRLLEAVRSQSIRVFDDHGNAIPPVHVSPRILPEAQPTEHHWTIKYLHN